MGELLLQPALRDAETAAKTGLTGIKPPVIREGPIPAAVHGLLEYAAGGAFVVAPFLLGFDSGSATAVSIVVGIALITMAATTSGSTSLVDQLPVAVHVLLDYALVAVLITSPFLFGFSDETEPTAFFIGLGVLHLLITIGTRFRSREEGSKA